LRSPTAERAFALPVATRTRWWIWPLAVAFHVPLVWGLQQRSDVDGTFLAPLTSTASTPIIVAMPYRAVASRAVRPIAPPASDQPSTARATATRPAREDGGVLVAPALPAPSTPSAAASAPAPTASASAFRPSYGTGQLWVRPLPMSAREMAAAATGKSQQELADSVVARVVQGYLDALAAERQDLSKRPPSWTTQLGGQKVGLDGQWIYLGPIKLPTVLLGLLPINLQGNPTQAEMNKRFSAMREDLFYAARRAATLEEFKKNVAELRKQKQYEYDLRKAQRTLPDSGRP